MLNVVCLPLEIFPHLRVSEGSNIIMCNKTDGSVHIINCCAHSVMQHTFLLYSTSFSPRCYLWFSIWICTPICTYILLKPLSSSQAFTSGGFDLLVRTGEPPFCWEIWQKNKQANQKLLFHFYARLEITNIKLYNNGCSLANRYLSVLELKHGL